MPEIAGKVKKYFCLHVRMFLNVVFCLEDDPSFTKTALGFAGNAVNKSC